MEKIVVFQVQMIDMTKKLNIAIVGLGQIGNYLYNELNTKKKDILKKTGKIISVSAISAKNIFQGQSLPLATLNSFVLGSIWSNCKAQACSLYPQISQPVSNLQSRIKSAYFLRLFAAERFEYSRDFSRSDNGYGYSLGNYILATDLHLCN